MERLNGAIAGQGLALKGSAVESRLKVNACKVAKKLKGKVKNRIKARDCNLTVYEEDLQHSILVPHSASVLSAK